jgi:septum formation protein
MDDIIYHKPVDEADACQILRTLSGNTHEVITGVCLLARHKQVVFTETARVQFASLTEAEIQYYVHHFQPYDKAGAYAIQEWIGLCKIEKIEGTYSNIVGLPMARVYQELEAF